MNASNMIRITFEEMKTQFREVLIHHNFSVPKAEQCAEIFAGNSLDGIYSHGVNRFPRFVEYIQKGYIKIDAEPKKIASVGNLEQWDGQLGPGPINATIASERCMSLAAEHGLGMVALSNTNHWMRGGSYGWNCAKKGFAFLGWTNTIANLPSWGAKEAKLGNNPLVIAIPYGVEAIVLDTAMSQYSYGKMEDLVTNGGQLPYPGGFNQAGQLTTNPGEILETGRALPIGYWKGAGLSLLLDLLATILSAGLSTSGITKQGKDEYGISQVFIAIDLKKLPNFPLIENTLQQIITDYLTADPVDEKTLIRYPGQNILKTRNENLQNGIPVNQLVWEKIKTL
jgi:3-dehydro-L-gulonate 2-dehydrogenase